MSPLPYPCRCYAPAPLSRRDYLRQLGAGFGSLALAGLLAEEKHAAKAHSPSANPLLPKPAHFRSRAKRAIMLFMDGGPSHHDLFDYKPFLVRDHGQPLPFKLPRVLSNADRFGNLLAPLAKFRQRGQSGVWMSDLLPNLAEIADDLCVIQSLHCSNPQHGAACLEWHTGSGTFVRPSLGSWLTYGLGSENQNLPGYITMCQPLASGGVGLYGSAFLPAAYQGTPLGYERMPAAEARFRFIESQHARPKLQQMELDLIREMGREHLDRSGPDSALEARINSFELAFRMQTEAPEVQDISGESAATRALYGLDDKPTASFGQQCLLARRFVERGVRFVQCNLGGWDHHYNLRSGLPANARQMDKPIAGLIQDLKSRGLLEETLVIWGGEFGRTPVAEGGNGRDHNPYGYTMWLAGGGVRGGLTYGQTDDYGFHAIENKVHVHDLHATILHLLGLDHEKLTYPYAGRNFRLTDVEGRVVHEIMT
jgi:hypothetical protein